MSKLNPVRTQCCLFVPPLGVAGTGREEFVCACLCLFLGWAGGSVQGSIFNGYGVCLTAQVLGRKVEISRISERDEINKVDLSLT